MVLPTMNIWLGLQFQAWEELKSYYKMIGYPKHISTTSAPLGLSCHTRLCFGWETLKLGSAYDCCFPFQVCINPSSIMRVNSHGRSFQHRSSLFPSSLVSEVCAVFRKRVLPSTSGGWIILVAEYKWPS